MTPLNYSKNDTVQHLETMYRSGRARICQDFFKVAGYQVVVMSNPIEVLLVALD